MSMPRLLSTSQSEFVYVLQHANTKQYMMANWHWARDRSLARVYTRDEAFNAMMKSNFPTPETRWVPIGKRFHLDDEATNVLHT